MTRVPLETWEQEKIAKWLDAQGILWCHVPNEMISIILSYQTNLSKGEVKGMLNQGVKAGVPDLLIFSPPSTGNVGTAIEMKRQPPRFKPPSDIQKHWLKQLEECGWLTYVAKGASDGIRFLQQYYIEHCPEWNLA